MVGTQKKKDHRVFQVEKQIQESLARYLLSHFNVSEDGVISVTRVQVPRDLKTANVYVHHYGVPSGDGPAELVEKLNHRVGQIQKYLASDLKLRYCPRLKIFYDGSFDKTLAVEKLIHDMAESGVIKKTDYDGLDD